MDSLVCCGYVFFQFPSMWKLPQSTSSIIILNHSTIVKMFRLISTSLADTARHQRQVETKEKLNPGL